MGLVHLTGKPSVKYGIPFPVMARASMGVRGANFPAVVRGIVAIFWYGVQTCFASTAVALLLRAFMGTDPQAATLLGLTAIDWAAYVMVCVFQVALFVRGVDWVTRFQLGRPAGLPVMIVLMIAIWYQAGPSLLGALGDIFSGSGEHTGGPIAAFAAVVGTMVAYFAAVVINYGDFARFVKDERQMRIGNFFGLPVSLAVFSMIALVITAGTVVVFGETLTNPTDIVARIDNVTLTVVAAITFFAATVGITVANFILRLTTSPTGPPGDQRPDRWLHHCRHRLFHRRAVGGLHQRSGHRRLCRYAGRGAGAAVRHHRGGLLPVRRQRLDVQQLFCAERTGIYHFNAGWNRKAMIAFGVSAVFSVASVWTPGLESLSGFAWLLGALFGGTLHYVLMRKQPSCHPVQPAPLG